MAGRFSGSLKRVARVALACCVSDVHFRLWASSKVVLRRSSRYGMDSMEKPGVPGLDTGRMTEVCHSKGWSGIVELGTLQTAHWAIPDGVVMDRTVLA